MQFTNIWGNKGLVPAKHLLLWLGLRNIVMWPGQEVTFQNGGITWTQKWGKERAWIIMFENVWLSLCCLNMFIYFYTVRHFRDASSTVNSLRWFIFKILLLRPAQAVKPFHKHFIHCNPTKLNLKCYAIILDCSRSKFELVNNQKRIIYPNQVNAVYGIERNLSSSINLTYSVLCVLAGFSWEKKGFVTEQESELGSNQRTNPLRVWSHFPLSGWWVPAASLKPLPTFPFNEGT